MEGVTETGTRRRWATGAVKVLVASALFGAAQFGIAYTLADDEGGGGSPPPAGEPYVDEVEHDLGPNVATDRSITTGGTTYDPNTLTKFIAGAEFDAEQGDGPEDDLLTNSSGDDSCVYPDTDGGGSFGEVYAGVELPDGALIKRVIAYGGDSYGPEDMEIELALTTMRVPVVVVGSVTRSDSTPVSFDTSTASGNFAIASPSNLDIVTGSSGSPATGVDHRFFSVYVKMWGAAGVNHTLCGVEIQYQVPTRAGGDGATFYPIDPIRAYDGRIPSYTNSGILAPNTSKLISVEDGHDDAGVVTFEDVVPPGATAVTYNATIAGPTGPNFIAVTPGDATGFTASAVNFDGTTDVANAGTVTLDADRQVRIWAGDQAGSMFVIIDITGYYLPANHPNMGN